MSLHWSRGQCLPLSLFISSMVVGRRLRFQVASHAVVLMKTTIVQLRLRQLSHAPLRVAKSRTSLVWGKGANVTIARCMV